jgi:hypothetical protein
MYICIHIHIYIYIYIYVYIYIYISVYIYIGSIPPEQIAFTLLPSTGENDLREGTEVEIDSSDKRIRYSQALVSLMVSLEKMAEERSFPEGLLGALDLCILESSTLLLLRRGSALIVNVESDNVAEGNSLIICIRTYSTYLSACVVPY